MRTTCLWCASVYRTRLVMDFDERCSHNSVYWRINRDSLEENDEEDKEEDDKEEEDTLQAARSQPYGRTSNRCRSRSHRRTSSPWRTNGQEKVEKNEDIEEEGKANHDEEEEDVKVMLTEDEEREEEMDRRAAVQFIKELRKNEAEVFWHQERELRAPSFDDYLEIRRNGEFVLHAYCIGLHRWFHRVDGVWYPQES